EARAAARLHHTNIVPVFGVGESEGLHYYVMQFISGLGLDAVLEEIRRLRSAGPGEDASAGAACGGAGTATEVAWSFRAGWFMPAPAQESSEERPAASRGPPWLAPARPPSAVLPSQCWRSSATDSSGRYARRVALVGEQVAEALEYAHRQGILHR